MPTNLEDDISRAADSWKGDPDSSYQVPGVQGPGDMIVILTHDESIRNTALMLAIKYHTENTIKDSQMYQMIKMDSNRKIEALDVSMVINTADQFSKFIKTGQVKFDKNTNHVVIGTAEEPADA